MDESAVGEERLAPLVELVERLRGEVTELHGRWEALGEELEAKRRRLRLAEATVNLMQRRGEEEGAEGGAGGGEHVSPSAPQASVGYQAVPEARPFD
jgi:hypothetical protein